MSNQLTEILENSGLEIATQETIEKGLGKFFNEFNNLAALAKNIIVSDENQKHLMKDAKEMRLKFVKIRTTSGKIKDKLKEDSKAYDKTVMKAYNLIKQEVEAVEAHLSKQEKFAEIKEAERVNKLAAERKVIAEPLDKWIPRDVTFGKLTDEEFNRILTGAKLTKEHEEKEAIKAAEAEKQAKLDQELLRAENKRIKEENDKLQADKEAAEAELLTGKSLRELPVEEPIVLVNGAEGDFSSPMTPCELLLLLAYEIEEIPFPTITDEWNKKVMLNAGVYLKKAVDYIRENAKEPVNE